jgi:hypothetical protein
MKNYGWLLVYKKFRQNISSFMGSIAPHIAWDSIWYSFAVQIKLLPLKCIEIAFLKVSPIPLSTIHSYLSTEFAFELNFGRVRISPSNISPEYKN